jgi:hypothetical protein
LELSRRHGIKSFLIPATVPNRYRNALDLYFSHVAIAIPCKEDYIYIIDAAFYFTKPLKINLKVDSKKCIFLKNIQKDQMDKANFEMKMTIENKIFNQFQRIKGKTNYVKSFFENYPNDPWYYYLREIKNPDQTIGETFIKIKTNPFICMTKLKRNVVASSFYLIDLKDKNEIILKINNTDAKTFDKSHISDKDQNYLQKIFKGFINIQKLIKHIDI